jgi:hypothetical protein
MKLCGKPVPKAKNGSSRGRCTLTQGHRGQHGSESCFLCGVHLAFQNSNSAHIHKGRRSGWCRPCATKDQQKRWGWKPRNVQHIGQTHRCPCGCSGVLPKTLGNANQFVLTVGGRFICRVSQILNNSQGASKRDGYQPIPLDTPHSIVRKMMAEPNCERCGEPLSWEFGLGKTPHLHHDHETGEPLGFTHPVCNPNAMEDEIDRLRKENRRLKKSVPAQGVSL